MKERTKQHLDQAIGNSRFDLGQFFGKGFELWKEQAGLYIAFMLLSFVISFIANLIPIVGPIGNNMVITPILYAGVLIFTHQIAIKGRPEFKHFFDGVEYAGSLIGAYALFALIIVIIIAPFGLYVYFNMDNFTAAQEPTEVYQLMMTLLPLLFIFFLILMVVYLFFAHVKHFILFYKLGVMDSIRYSARLFLKHPFMFIIYFILLGLLMMSGLIGLIVCVILTMSFGYPMLYTPFRYLTDLDGFENNDATSDVVDTLLTF